MEPHRRDSETELRVRLCIHRTDADTCFRVEDFLHSRAFLELLDMVSPGSAGHPRARDGSPLVSQETITQEFDRLNTSIVA